MAASSKTPPHQSKGPQKFKTPLQVPVFPVVKNHQTQLHSTQSWSATGLGRKQKFMKHQHIPARSWRDFVSEITSYFEEWLDGMEVRDFKSLKDFLITDQLKKRVPGEIREHFMGEWAKFYEPFVLAEKLNG
ncbi:CCHC-type domain-containing protein [Trichonephila clavipes]|nr:CCHC-type domain-containing protein [Trichonephila clavipes]